jgi:hypothetical protein
MNETHYFQRRIWLAATLIVVALALAIPDLQSQPDLQTRAALAIPCILAGAWSLPPLLVNLTHAMVEAYERITRQRVEE